MFRQFQISETNFYDNVIIAMEKLHMGYDTIMGMWMYDFQNVLERYSKIVEERNEEEKKQNEEYEKKYGGSPDRYLKQYTPKLSKLPDMGKVKL